eukprot:14381098-Heterocapsa_arctica.AAC.1
MLTQLFRTAKLTEGVRGGHAHRGVAGLARAACSPEELQGTHEQPPGQLAEGNPWRARSPKELHGQQHALHSRRRSCEHARHYHPARSPK